MKSSTILLTIATILPSAFAGTVYGSHEIHCAWGNGKWQDFWNMRNNLCAPENYNKRTQETTGAYSSYANFIGNGPRTHCWEATQDIIEYALATDTNGQQAYDGGYWCDTPACKERYIIIGHPNQNAYGNTANCVNTG